MEVIRDQFWLEDSVNYSNNARRQPCPFGPLKVMPWDQPHLMYEKLHFWELHKRDVNNYFSTILLSIKYGLFAVYLWQRQNLGGLSIKSVGIWPEEHWAPFYPKRPQCGWGQGPVQDAQVHLLYNQPFHTFNHIFIAWGYCYSLTP